MGVADCWALADMPTKNSHATMLAFAATISYRFMDSLDAPIGKMDGAAEETAPLGPVQANEKSRFIYESSRFPALHGGSESDTVLALR